MKYSFEGEWYEKNKKEKENEEIVPNLILISS